MREKPTHIARVLSPSGIYPARTTAFSDAVFVADEELSFSVYKITTDTRGHDGEDESYSEVQWLNPAETRLFGSLQLSFDVETQYLSFHPHFACEALTSAPRNLDDEDWLLGTVKPLLAEKISAPETTAPGYSVPQANSYQRSRIELPPIAADSQYDFRTDDIDYDLSQKLHESISLRDDLYVRGIYALIKAAMLRRDFEYLEEGILMLFISMEVAFRLVVKELRAQGITDPTSQQAMEYIFKAFNETHRLEGQGVEKWFEEYYDRRVMSLHPESRYGIVPHAPLYADDFGFLYRDMVEVLRFLICGYTHPRHQDANKVTRGGL